MPPTDAAVLLAAYDEQLRARVPARLPAGETVTRDGPLLRFEGGPIGGWVLYRDLGGLEGPALDALIRRQLDVFAAAGQRFEWKYHGHDRPADLADRLLAAGFVPEPAETIVIGRVADLTGTPVLPHGVTLREVTSRRDFERIGRLEQAVWDDDEDWVAEVFESELAIDPDGLTIVVAEAGDTVVCAAWIRYVEGTAFATLWGGATLPEWRKRGIYRATVMCRANLAAARGFDYLETDASDDSRPILERLGFVPVTTTTPYVWKPAGG